MLEVFGIERSLSAKGCPYDNAVDESTDRIRRPGSSTVGFGTTRELRAKLSDDVHWYDNFRIYSTLGYMSPIESREAGLSLPRIVQIGVANPTASLIISRGYLGFFDWGGCYVAESLRDEDCFSEADDVHLVTHIFSRQNDKKLYKILCLKMVSSMIPRFQELLGFLDISSCPLEDSKDARERCLLAFDS